MKIDLKKAAELLTKYKNFVLVGFIAASIDFFPGQQIGDGGNPFFLYVL